jgi:hypothetical protein
VVSRPLLTEVAEVRSPVILCGICGGQSRAGAGFVRVLLFNPSALISPNAPLLSAVIWGWYNGTFTAFVAKGSVSPPEEQKCNSNIV